MDQPVNAGDLRQRLEAEGVRGDAYALNGEHRDEAYCLEQETRGWTVYYEERGEQTGQRRFESEDAACQYLLNLILRDSTTRM